MQKPRSTQTQTLYESQEKLHTRVVGIVKDYLRSTAFGDRKVTDFPTDALQVVNRKYVTLNGTTGARPTSSVIGQSYFDTTLGYPVWYGPSGWVDASGNPV